jgi:hypothetical protein
MSGRVAPLVAGRANRRDYNNQRLKVTDAAILDLAPDEGSSGSLEMPFANRLNASARPVLPTKWTES